MKKASKFEKVAARCWNLLNEGKPFTPIFTVSTYAMYNVATGETDGATWLAIIYALPLFTLFFRYDFPLFLRNYLWLPLVAFLLLFGEPPLALLGFSACLYLFFTIYFWGTFYYHLRIGTSWWNFTRFWKLVLKNSDSTSGNAQEQLPKVFLLLSVMSLMQDGMTEPQWASLGVYFVGLVLYTIVLHRYLFDWKPAPLAKTTNYVAEAPFSDRVVVLVVDGMRKERFMEANTPFLDSLRKNGTDFLQMETVYPARTVVCFSSMFTGTYPFEHGITSNMVWKLGLKTESIFDSLRKVGKKGKMLGIAHLVDSFGPTDCETVTAVMHKDEADRNILERAKQMLASEPLDLAVVQFIGTDQIGHSRGVLYDEYIEKIEEVDALIAELVEWMTERGMMTNTTLIVCADHGQADGIGGHGHLDEGERYVPFFMSGAGIQQGKLIEEKHSLVSLAATIAQLLGAPLPDHARGPVLREALKERE